MKGDNLSVPDPENKEDVVKQASEAGELFLELPLKNVVAHCCVKE